MTGQAPAQESQARPLVAIVGRPNVGKSALFNRIVGGRVAIVEEQPGATRDRKQAEAGWSGTTFDVVDTGGWLAARDGLERRVSAQAERAIAEATLLLFVVDVTVGSTAEDEAVADLLRRGRAPVVLVVNKVDNDERVPDAWRFARLGLGDPVMVSALHGRGTGDLLDEVVARLAAEGAASTENSADGAAESSAPRSPSAVAPEEMAGSCTGVAIVGRPNVGKSTLFNRIVRDDRSIVHDLPGTTRDAIDTVVETDEGRLRFIDTAGMRRRSRIAEGVEYYSLVRSLDAIDRADVAILLIDAAEGVTHQDQRLAERIDAAGSPVVVVLNKWERLDAGGRESALAGVGDRLAFLGYAPVVRVSALTGRGVHKLLPAVGQAIDAYRTRIPTSELNRLVQAAQAAHPPPRAKVRYAVQGATDPPTITLFASHELPRTWLRYLERRIREEFAMGPTPIKLRVRRQGRP